jgi:hypothetical protein
VEKVKRSIRTTFFLTVVGVEGKEDWTNYPGVRKEPRCKRYWKRPGRGVRRELRATWREGRKPSC